MSKTTDATAVGSPQLIYRGVKEIADFVGINPKRFVYYKDNLGLPVFKTDESSKIWLATHHDLVGWVERRKSVFFGDVVQV